jgi:hypothetical protein
VNIERERERERDVGTVEKEGGRHENKKRQCVGEKSEFIITNYLINQIIDLHNQLCINY